MKLGFMLLSCWLVGATAGMAQDFAGHYELSSNVGIHRLELQQTGDRLLGTLITANGHRYRLEAQIEGNGATGFLMGDQSREAVELYLEGLQLKVGIYPIDPQSGHIFFDQGQQFAFNRVAGEEAGSMASPSGEVSSEVTLRPVTSMQREPGTGAFGRGVFRGACRVDRRNAPGQACFSDGVAYIRRRRHGDAVWFL